MSSSVQIWLDGQPADDGFYGDIASLEVEENLDLPGAFELQLPVRRSESSDLSFVSDGRFRPFANVAVVASTDDQQPQCIFDGYVLSHKLHLDRGVVDSTVQIWGQDASWLMNLEERAREWLEVTDAAVAASIFGDYGFDPSPDNTWEDSPAHTEQLHSLMQRGTDSDFLKRLARANGKFFRVFAANKPGERTGYFARPKLDGDAVATIALNDAESWTVEALDFEWDVMRPSLVQARQALFTDSDPDGTSVEVDNCGLTLLDARSLADFSGKKKSALLTATVDDAGGLKMRAQALLREAGCFARCVGEADVMRLKSVLRAGSIVQLEGVGALNSGKYLVASVRHSIAADSHRMKFTLMRNSVGPDAEGAGGGLLGGFL